MADKLAAFLRRSKTFPSFVDERSALTEVLVVELARLLADAEKKAGAEWLCLAQL